MNVPIFNSYSVESGLWAGEYPGHFDPKEARKKIDAFREFGITDFIDLTSDSFLRPYEEFLPESMRRHTFPITDQSVPDGFGLMDEIIGLIDTLLRENRKVYIHCWGGVGRTGTVVACWLGHHFRTDGEAALRLLRQKWETCPKSKRIPYSPENALQSRYVIDYLARFDSEEPESDEKKDEPDPELEHLIRYVKSLRADILSLIMEREKLTLHLCPQIEALYITKIGALEFAVYEWTFKIHRIKRKLELIRAARNRNEKPDIDRIEKRLDAETEEYQKKIAANKLSVKKAIVSSNAPLLSEEESDKTHHLYRKIMKKLHPDLNPNLGEMEKQLLHKAIDAYKSSDIDTLKLIELAIDEVEEEDLRSEKSFEKLIQLRDALTEKRNTLMQAVEKIKDSFPYNQQDFLADEKAVERKKREYEELLDSLKEQYAEFEKVEKDLLF